MQLRQERGSGAQGGLPMQPLLALQLGPKGVRPSQVLVAFLRGLPEGRGRTHDQAASRAHGNVAAGTGAGSWGLPGKPPRTALTLCPFLHMYRRNRPFTSCSRLRSSCSMGAAAQVHKAANTHGTQTAVGWQNDWLGCCLVRSARSHTSRCPRCARCGLHAHSAAARPRGLSPPPEACASAAWQRPQRSVAKGRGRG